MVMMTTTRSKNDSASANGEGRNNESLSKWNVGKAGEEKGRCGVWKKETGTGTGTGRVWVKRGLVERRVIVSYYKERFVTEIIMGRGRVTYVERNADRKKEEYDLERAIMRQVNHDNNRNTIDRSKGSVEKKEKKTYLGRGRNR